MAEFDPTRAKPETVRALCESIESVSPSDTFHWARQLRSECRMRTRAEIATDLVAKLGCSAYGGGPGHSRQLVFNIPDGVTVTELLDLLVEFGRAKDSGPSSVDAADGGPPPAVPVSPAGADLLQRLELVERYIGPSALAWARGQQWHCPTDCECRAVPVSGPPGAAAAKESSKDSAAAPAGAALVCADCGLTRNQESTVAMRRDSQYRCNDCASRKPLGESHACNPGERECNCEQSLALKREYERQSKLSADLLRERGETILELMLFRNGKKEPAAALDAIALIVGAWVP